MKMRSYWSRVSPLSNVTGVLTEKGSLDTETNTHAGTMPCEDGVMLPPATELPEAGRGQKQILP